MTMYFLQNEPGFAASMVIEWRMADERTASSERVRMVGAMRSVPDCQIASRVELRPGTGVTGIGSSTVRIIQILLLSAVMALRLGRMK